MSWQDALEACEVTELTVRPRYLTPADTPWLGELVEGYAQFVGCPRGDLREWLAEPGVISGPRALVAATARVLDRQHSTRTVAVLEPRCTRELVFERAANSDASRHQVLCEVARECGVSLADIESSMFADLPDRRLLVAPKAAIAVDELMAQVNLSLAEGLLRRARTVVIRAHADVRQAVRAAKLRGLIISDATSSCPALEGNGSSLEIAGPLSVLRRTLVYGRALASLLVPLRAGGPFELDADCELGPDVGDRRLELSDRDPIYPARLAERGSSRQHERFQRDFERTMDEWLLTREPSPLLTADGLMFPDFSMTHRENPDERWLIEIVGFWTPEYLERKAAALASLPADVARRFIVCVDEERHAARGTVGRALPRGMRVLRYRRRVRVEDVLAVVGRESVVNDMKRG